MSEVTIPDRDDFKIGEVCEIVGVKPFVLRYWETEFAELAPAKGAGGQRTYSKADVEIILRIKQLLYEERFTVVGAKKRLAEELARKAPRGEGRLDREGAEPVERLRQVLAHIRRELEDVVGLLKQPN
ncbi:MAG: MerR family transcriptional regulator [Thermoanaerobaculaceae bacterium]|jgi:DNA-binding transcriptional MerR regulator|nr:MerR family transcriptional regulator [Thermoanaerobaculaceae bacterium]